MAWAFRLECRCGPCESEFMSEDALFQHLFQAAREEHIAKTSHVNVPLACEVVASQNRERYRPLFNMPI
eukprot:1046749-Karenia_brevis.AAC.1